ncbi:hypothetical protein BOX15_Mlig025539g2 [Macrostomum lignano]|uniref:Uncharacterized protein n=1 Tax=Macrostomum lignano TaxID=282301 RepID=A0A267E9S9_9PLAT|nr:hypothetical protein BOX15_Mlig025539g2 [Macrostomum lignano]
MSHLKSQQRRRVNCRDCTLDIRVSMVLLEIQPGESEHSDGAESVSSCASPVQNDEEKPEGVSEQRRVGSDESAFGEGSWSSSSFPPTSHLVCRLTNSSDSCSSGGDSAIVRSPVESAVQPGRARPVYTADTDTENCTTDFTYASVVSRLESDDSDTLPALPVQLPAELPTVQQQTQCCWLCQKADPVSAVKCPSNGRRDAATQTVGGKVAPPSRVAAGLPAAQSHRRTAESRSAGAAAAAHLWTRSSFSPSQRQQQVQNRAKTDPRTINSSPGLSRRFPTSQMPLKCISGSWGKRRELWKEWRPTS